ncbi:hypothetical protein [Natrinema altunense]|uniref:Uncharacterized protein n=1 Tax=Natrinema altunense (strain JCM 12890 / CGMCC 1.3731 / AJ2) TaxID=1227494 RepID=M0A2S0_NATA2|nr:hypothetical protein [Natrinema altunense]ELY91648.1 hypothetical protein C485_01430 [Natrinema altunense JCM 12890]
MASLNPDGDLTRSTIAGLLCVVVFLPTTYLALNAYVALTISVGPTDVLSRVIDAALVAGSLTAFCGGVLSHHLLRSRSPDGG